MKRLSADARAKRDAAIKARHAAGEDPLAIATTYRLTTVRVIQIVSGYDEIRKLKYRARRAAALSATVFVSEDWLDFEDAGNVLKLEPPAAPRMKGKSQTKRREDDFATQCKAYRLPIVWRGHRFAKSIGRRWEFDFAFQDYLLAVEIEGLAVRRIGGQFVCTGRHTTPGGFEQDCQKYATAVLLGWTVVRFMTKQVASKYAIEMTQRILTAKGWKGANHDETDATAARPAAAT